MSKPESMKNDPWTDFPHQPFSIIYEDFCHDKPLVMKFFARNDRATLNIKETVNQRRRDWSVSDQVKFWFNLPTQGTIYAKIKSSDYLKFHYDHGLTQWKKRSWNFYAGFNSNKTLKNCYFKFGAAHIFTTGHSDNRLRIGLDEDFDASWHWYHRTAISHDQLKLGVITVVNLRRIILEKNNILLAYTHDQNHSIFFRAEVNGFRKENVKLNHLEKLFDSFIFDYVYNIDEKSKAAFEAGYDMRKKEIKTIQAVYQTELQNKVQTKIGLDRNLDIRFLMKRPVYGLESIAKLTTGVGLSGILKGRPSFKTGFQLDVNL